MLSSGFRNWSKSDFQNFISANERYGRDNIEDISKAIGKSVQDVEIYSKVFWEKATELSEYERIIKNIEMGEGRQEQ